MEQLDSRFASGFDRMNRRYMPCPHRYQLELVRDGGQSLAYVGAVRMGARELTSGSGTKLSALLLNA